MIICRTPFRISFFGGGTDYPAWYREHGGAVLAATINKYCYLTCRNLPPFFEHRYRVVYSKSELCTTIDEITHPAAREVLRFMNIDRGVEIHHDGDLPARSGMGSSSSFTVALLHALHGLKGKIVCKEQLTREAIHIEQEVLKENVGSQDQVMAAHGGFNYVGFLPNGEIIVRPLPLSVQRLRELNDHLLLVYTGIKRTASNVAESYLNGIDTRRRQLRILRDLVDESLSVLSSERENVNTFGELLHEGWMAKRSLSKEVTNSAVDQLYEEARSAGAIGGKLLGAGGGGFLLLFTPPEFQAQVREKLNHFLFVPFKFEFTGSQIIFLDRQEDYSQAEEDRAKHTIHSFRELTPNSP
jgi:D-glycero-alpha-D-manno-heptose-7-phosphate kinase